MLRNLLSVCSTYAVIISMKTNCVYFVVLYNRKDVLPYLCYWVAALLNKARCMKRTYLPKSYNPEFPVLSKYGPFFLEKGSFWFSVTSFSFLRILKFLFFLLDIICLPVIKHVGVEFESPSHLVISFKMVLTVALAD